MTKSAERLGSLSALAAIVAVGALLRFATLGEQELWLDEAVTQGLLREDLHDMLATISGTESTPPLYYLLARAWVVPFGSGATAVRALSALFGTLTIPVAYAAASTLLSRRAGLYAAALTAVSPALIWYSQEARSYALLVFLCGLTVLFLVRALRLREPGTLAWWAVVAALAIATHYFAVFLVAAEAAWLLLAHPRRRATLLPLAAVGVCGLLLLPLAITQSSQGNLDWIGMTSLVDRLGDTGELFLAGQTAGRLDYLVPVLAILVAVSLTPLVRARAVERRAVVVPASLAAAAIVAPVAIDAAGANYVIGRNLLPAWLPMAMVVAISLSSLRSTVVEIGFVVVWVLAAAWPLAAVLSDRTLQRAAITAAVVPTPLDPERERIEPRVGYARGSSVRAQCPAGTAAVDGGASRVVEGPDEPLPEALIVHGPRGWTGGPPPGSDQLVSAYVICTGAR